MASSKGKRGLSLEWPPGSPAAAQQGGVGAFSRAAEELRTRWGAAVEAERQEQKAALRRLYERSSLEQLREEGVLLTELAASEEMRLFSDFVWRLYPHPRLGSPQQQGRQGQQQQSPGQGGPGRQGFNSRGFQNGAPAGELPYHKFQRGDSVLVTWHIPQAASNGAAAQQQSSAGSAAGQSVAGPRGSVKSEKPGRGSGSEAEGSGSWSDGQQGGVEGGGVEERSQVEGTVLEVRRGHLLLTFSRDASTRLEELMEGGWVRCMDGHLEIPREIQGHLEAQGQSGRPPGPGGGAILRIDKGSKDVTSQRQLEALSRLESFHNPENRGEQLVRAVILGAPASRAEESPAWARSAAAAAAAAFLLAEGPDSWVSAAQRELHTLPNLNWSQKAAIASAMRQTFSLWQGPPGTGKTRTMLGFMELLCRTNARRGPAARQAMGPILATADTNAAVDNLVEGLLQRGIRVVRVGQAAKVRPELREACLDALLEKTASGQRAAALRERSLQLRQAAREGKASGKLTRQDATALRKESDSCWDQADALLAGAADMLLSKAEVVAATCTGCGDPRLRGVAFRMVVIDEASQATEPSTLVPLLKGAECVVLAGDIKQLPPTVISRRALALGLDVPLLKRLQEGGLRAHLLQEQYRMHPDIAAFPAQHFYGGAVKSAVAPQDRPLVKGPKWQAGCPVLFLHQSWPEERASSSSCDAATPAAAAAAAVKVAVEGAAGEERGSSYANRGEAQLAMAVLWDVVQANQDLETVALLTPYNGQVRQLTKLFRKLQPQLPAGIDITISTVDGYQGREADLVIFSTVRSNSKGYIGFVADERRLNVAITRARRGLIVIGNGDTLSTDPNWRAWLRANTGDGEKQLAPWTLTFDLRERETIWTQENQARLVRIVASYELNLDVQEVEYRLHLLSTILPGLEARVAYIKPSILAGLLGDPAVVLDRLLKLKDLLPEADVGKIAVGQPQLLLQDTAAVTAELAKVRQLLPVPGLDKAIEDNPGLLDAEAVSEVLEELRRLMPSQGPVALLLQDPSWMLRVERGSKRLGQPPDEPC
ncbi:hypothetical protein N2152v2_007400 [Parachlorella kessleri]